MSFSKNLTQQAALMDSLEDRLNKLTALQQQFVVNSEQEPHQSDWEAAWVAAGNTAPIPQNKPLVWTWKNTIRGEYLKAKNNYFSFMLASTNAAAPLGHMYQFYVKGWYDNESFLAYGEVINPATDTYTTGSYQLWSDGSYRLINAAVFLGWLPNQKKGVFISGTNVQLYDEVLNTFTTLFNIGVTGSSNTQVSRRVFVNPTNSNQFSIAVGNRIGFWNGSTGVSWTPVNAPLNGAFQNPRVWMFNNLVYWRSTGSVYIRSTATGTGETITTVPPDVVTSPDNPARVWAYNRNKGYEVTESNVDMSNAIVRRTHRHFARVAEMYTAKDRQAFAVDSMFESRVIKGNFNSESFPSPDRQNIALTGLFGVRPTVLSTVDRGTTGGIIRTTAYSEPDPDYLSLGRFVLDTSAAAFTVDFASQIGNLDSKYQMLQLRFQNTATNNANLTLSFNNDATVANYDTSHSSIAGAVWTNAATAAVGGIFVQTGSVNASLQTLMWLFNARETAAFTTVLYLGANAVATQRQVFGAGAWRNTAVPTQYTFTLPTGTFAAGTLVELIAYKTKPRFIDPNLGGN